MNKNRNFFVIASAVVLSLLLNVLFGRWLSVKLSTWPLLNRYKLISPQAPIVITNNQTVRVSDSGDIQQAITSVRPKLSLVMQSGGGQASVLGAALNLTSDGLFVTSKAAVSGQKQANLSLKLDDGTVAPVTAMAVDAATGLVVLKTSLQSVPVAGFTSSKDATAGQRVILVAPDVSNFSSVFYADFIGESQTDVTGDRSSDQPSRAFRLQDSGTFLAGTAVADLNGNLLGMWDGSRVVSIDVIKDLSDIYLSNGGQIVRPQFGFSYVFVSQTESKLLGGPQGAKIVSETVGQSAQKGGLMVNDVIQSWGTADITGNDSLEVALANNKPGDTVAVKIMRGKTSMTLNLTAGQLK